MAKAYQCDICGKLFSEKESPTIQYEDFILITHRGNIRTDVCKKCHKELQEWVKSRLEAVKEETEKRKINNSTEDYRKEDK